MKRHYQTISFLHETQFQYKQYREVEYKIIEKMYYANINKRKTGVAILISGKVDFRANYQIGTLHNDKRVSSLRRNSHHKQKREQQNMYAQKREQQNM